MARPLRVHELDMHAFGMMHFDMRGLIVAEREGDIVGFAHAGFGPDGPGEPVPPPRLNRGMGAIVMLIVSPEEDREVDRGLVLRAEHYLREEGARVIYLGGQYPLNPFYWGLYGGSEFAGVLSHHDRWHAVAHQLGYEPVGTTVVLEVNLDKPPPRDPHAAILRRQCRMTIHEDELPRDWWTGLALGEFHPTHVRLVSRPDDEEIARADVWDMSGFSRSEGRARIGIVDFVVAPPFRRNGYGRFLIGELLRTAREQMFAVAEVQTGASNLPALALYTSAGFHPIDEATLYRLPSQLMNRSVSDGLPTTGVI